MSSSPQSPSQGGVERGLVVAAMCATAAVVGVTWPPLFGPPEPWVDPDKVWHFLVSMAIASVLAWFAIERASRTMACRVVAPFVATMVIGVGKEVSDMFTHSDASLSDLAADAVGAVAGIAAFGLILRAIPRGPSGRRGEDLNERRTS